MKKIDAHLHLADVIAGYCRRGELRAIGQGKAMWGNGEVFQLIPAEYGDSWNFRAEKALELMDEARGARGADARQHVRFPEPVSRHTA